MNIEHSFITELSEIAKSKGIDVQYIDFKEYGDPIDTIIDIKNEGFRKTLEEVPQFG